MPPAPARILMNRNGCGGRGAAPGVRGRRASPGPEAALRAAGHPVRRVLLPPAGGFGLGEAGIPPEAAVAVSGNPTNSTSALHPAAVLADCARYGQVLVIDEAFMDAVPDEPESLAGSPDVPGLLVVRSLTRTWGLAGLRIGYLLGSAGLLEQLRAMQSLWPVSIPALACSSPRGGRGGVRADPDMRGAPGASGAVAPGDPRRRNGW